MSYQISMIPSQQMRLEQRLTPQLIQSMEILQLPLLALEARVREELEQNPVLEEVENHAEPEVAPAQENLPATEANLAEAESFARLERMSREMDLDSNEAPVRHAAAPMGERDAKMDAMANTESRIEGLRDSLTRQWGLVEASTEVRRAGELLIDWMDDDGYLRTDYEHHARDEQDDSAGSPPLIIKRTPEEKERLLEEIAYSRSPAIDMAVLRKALELVQTLDPTGVGACDLTECLLIQVRAQGLPDPLEIELIEHHLVNLAKKQFAAVAKATDRPLDEIVAAMKRIGKLNHHPGLVHRSRDIPGIAPDIILDYADQGDGFVIRLARGNTPKLRISPHYREMLADKDADKETKEYIKKRMESASVIVDAIQYRRQRLLELARIILDRQREFFDFGPQFLKVLLMREVAEEVRCDPSTISRTVDGKYIQTPRGIYPLRLFFTAGPRETLEGENHSWEAIKSKVKEIVDAEDKARPLTDEEITRRLSESFATPIARRTVAKYRIKLGIPSQRDRKAVS